MQFWVGRETIHMIVKEEGSFLWEYEDVIHMVKMFESYELEHKISAACGLLYLSVFASSNCGASSVHTCCSFISK